MLRRDSEFKLVRKKSHDPLGGFTGVRGAVVVGIFAVQFLRFGRVIAPLRI